MSAQAPTLLWLRRDLRLADNPALLAAADSGAPVLPVFIWAPEEEAPWQPGAASRWWLHHSLAALTQDLAACGLPLVIRRGESLAELRRLMAETGARAVHWNRLYEPALTARDSVIKAALREDGVEAHSHNSALLFEPWTLKTGSGDPYRVFTPFWKNAVGRLQHPRPQPAPRSVTAATPVTSLPLAALELLPRIAWDTGMRQHWQPGEAGAQALLARFLQVAAGYKAQRDLPAVDASSRLSPHLHFGEIGPVQIAAAVQARMAADTTPGLHAAGEHYIRELGWREFAHHLLYHYPQTPLQPLYQEKFGRFPWRAAADYASDLRAWQRGRTGIPIVDAGMRQLWHTGWMHNRVRMLVASLLTKNLLIPWQEGARWFWDTLVDASLANNTLGWQWSAGCGADAAPYFRIFNPVLQSAKFDADGVYLRRWVPELAACADEKLHAPWTAPVPPRGYPAPMVDLLASRDRALAAYGEIKADRSSN